jgi:hypothetical protein
VWQTWHKWADITPDQQLGSIAYLLSLTPVPQKGAINFGALTIDAGAGVPMDASSETSGAADAGTQTSDAGDAGGAAGD